MNFDLSEPELRDRFRLPILAGSIAAPAIAFIGLAFIFEYRFWFEGFQPWRLLFAYVGFLTVGMCIGLILPKDAKSSHVAVAAGTALGFGTLVLVLVLIYVLPEDPGQMPVQGFQFEVIRGYIDYILAGSMMVLFAGRSRRLLSWWQELRFSMDDDPGADDG